MEKSDAEYLRVAFSDLINYGADNPLEPVDPLSYRTPEGDSCLHIAAMRGDLRAVQLLLNAGLDVNLLGDLGNTPLHYARMAAHLDVIEHLISRGANPDFVNELGKKP